MTYISQNEGADNKLTLNLLFMRGHQDKFGWHYGFFPSLFLKYFIVYMEIPCSELEDNMMKKMDLTRNAF